MKVGAEKKNVILRRLREIEGKHAVRIVYACESGSRAWGFPSRDSDYDVRFLYLRPRDWYLSIRRGRDVIEEPILDEYDINGWDLKKALGLLYKSNPPLFEWLGSPIVYLERTSVPEDLRGIAPRFYSRRNCLAHYFHMAENNLRAYLRGDTVRTKKYFYVLRPVLAMQWIERGLGVVPTDFRVLVRRLVKDPVLLRDINSLMREKRSGAELRSGPRIESISSFIESEIERFGAQARRREERPPIAELDGFFLRALDDGWK